MKTKKGVRIINCARGGLVDELAVRDLLVSGHIAGAGFDVFTEEPATTNVLFGAPNLVSTPHLGAATVEAQENVALQVAEQMADYLLTGAVVNSLNMPNVSAEDAPSCPYLTSPKLRLVRRSAHRHRHQGGVDRVRGRCGGAQRQTAQPGGADGRAAPAARLGEYGERAGDRPRARHRGRRGQARARQRLQFDDPPYRHHRKIHPRRHRHAIRRQASAHRRHQGHRDRGRVRPAHALHHQRRQAGLHRPAGHHPGREQGQYRDLPSRPRQARRLGDRARPGRSASLQGADGRKIAAVQGVVRSQGAGCWSSGSPPDSAAAGTRRASPE